MKNIWWYILKPFIFIALVNLYLIFIDLIKILIVVDLNVDIYSFKSEAEEGDLNLDIL